MNAKPNSIGILPAMGSGLRCRDLRRPVTRVGFVRLVPTHYATPSTHAHLGLSLSPSNDRVGEFWEALSFAVIWLCGLTGIGLCFL